MDFQVNFVTFLDIYVVNSMGKQSISMLTRNKNREYSYLKAVIETNITFSVQQRRESANARSIGQTQREWQNCYSFQAISQLEWPVKCHSLIRQWLLAPQKSICTVTIRFVHDLQIQTCKLIIALQLIDQLKMPLYSPEIW